MKALSRWLGILMGLAGVLGCERDLPYMASVDQTISGYQVEGYVTDKLGIPIKGLKIGLWYDLEYIDSDAPPSRQFLVDDTAKIARVVVLDHQNRLRRVIFQGRAPRGYLDFEFDLRDSTGALLPTGIYTISYSLAGISKGSYTQVINGSVTAVTDSLGHYVIPKELLPIGFYPAPIYASDGVTFNGNYQITPYAILEFYLPIHRLASVTLTQDQITRFDFRI